MTLNELYKFMKYFFEIFEVICIVLINYSILFIITFFTELL